MRSSDASSSLLVSGTSASWNDTDYVQIDIERAHLLKNHQPLGMGKMDPFVKLTTTTDTNTVLTRTPTHWDSHFQPVWFHACPKINSTDPTVQLQFSVYNDSSLGPLNQKLMGQHSISIQELITRGRNTKAKSLGLAAKIQLELSNGEGTLVLSVKVKDAAQSTGSLISNGAEEVDPSWFESPVQRLGVSGGTAPFFALKLTELGMKETNQTSSSYFIGKDLSHAEDEKDFYDEIRQIAEYDREQTGVGLLVPFMFDYLGVLPTKTADTKEECRLLVMQNLRNDYKTFRMLDLKMGQRTAQGGWQGKSRFRAAKQGVIDGLTNSKGEGYRLEGFDGNPQRIESMDPLMDVLAGKTGNDIDNVDQSSRTLLWGKQVSEKDIRKAKRMMFQTFTGAEIFRYFLDVHLEPYTNGEAFGSLLPVEAVEIVSHELVSQLVDLAVTCHRLEIPQKWIGSSVALGYDAGLFPPRATSQESEQQIRSKVICNVFDWGRSELLTKQRYQGMTETEQQDRHHFWENYKTGMDVLAFNATRGYFHHFTNTTAWTKVTLQAMDFDSLKWDDYMGKVDIALPEPTDKDAIKALQQGKQYTLQAANGTPQGTIVCSITWLDFPANSRLVGVWRVTVERASNLPVKDVGTNSSDPYVVVIARDACNHRQLQQATCVKARNLNPIWKETVDLPLVRGDHFKEAIAAKGGMFDDSFPPEDRELATIFQFHERGQEDYSYWRETLKKVASRQK